MASRSETVCRHVRFHPLELKRKIRPHTEERPAGTSIVGDREPVLAAVEVSGKVFEGSDFEVLRLGVVLCRSPIDVHSVDAVVLSNASHEYN